MKTIQVTVYEAFDGSHFDTEEACAAYETEAWPKRFVGLTAEQVNAALDRSDPELADAFEKAGLQIRTLRYVQGQKRTAGRRKVADKATDPTEPTACDMLEEPTPYDPDFREVDGPTDAEIERSQSRLAAIIGDAAE